MSSFFYSPWSGIFGYALCGCPPNIDDRAILSAGRYHDSSEEGKFYAVILEQVQPVQQMQTGTVPTGTGETPFGQKMMTQE